MRLALIVLLVAVLVTLLVGVWIANYYNEQCPGEDFRFEVRFRERRPACANEGIY